MLLSGIAARITALQAMRKMGFEPTRGNPHKNLNLARLPVPTFPQSQDISYNESYSLSTFLYYFFKYYFMQE